MNYINRRFFLYSFTPLLQNSYYTKRMKGGYIELYRYNDVHNTKIEDIA